MAIAPKLGEKYYDLSDPVHKEMPFFPLSFPLEIEQVASTDAGGFNIHKITMGTHHGPMSTHRDIATVTVGPSKRSAWTSSSVKASSSISLRRSSDRASVRTI